MAVRRAKRKHSVKAELRIPALSKAGSSLNLQIYAKREKLGEVDIGRGSLYWRGPKRQRWKRISWSNFAERMNQLAYQP